MRDCVMLFLHTHHICAQDILYCSIAASRKPHDALCSRNHNSLGYFPLCWRSWQVLLFFFFYKVWHYLSHRLDDTLHQHHWCMRLLICTLCWLYDLYCVLAYGGYLTARRKGHDAVVTCSGCILLPCWLCALLGNCGENYFFNLLTLSFYNSLYDMKLNTR